MKNPLLLKETSSQKSAGLWKFLGVFFTIFTVAIFLIPHWRNQSTQKNASVLEQIENAVGALDSCPIDICNQCGRTEDHRLLRRNLVGTKHAIENDAFKYGLPAEGFGVLPYSKPGPQVDQCVACCGMFLKGLFNFNAINCDDQHLNNFICFNCKSIGTKCKTNRELGVCWKVASRTQTEGEHRDLFTCLRKEEQIDKYGGRMRSMVLAPPLMEVPDESPEIHSFPPGEKV